MLHSLATCMSVFHVHAASDVLVACPMCMSMLHVLYTLHPGAAAAACH
jgi:hypothetical protein